MLEKRKKIFLIEICYLYFYSAKVRVKKLYINTGGSYHFSLLQIIPSPDYFTKIPPLLFLRPSGKKQHNLPH